MKKARIKRVIRKKTAGWTGALYIHEGNTAK
jgi:hypothetical protein